MGKSGHDYNFISHYRAAVKAAAKGRTIDYFDRLNTLGCIRENLGTKDERRSELAHEYLAALERKERVLVVAQTRDEVHAVNETIRQQLRAQVKLGADTTVTTHHPVDMGEAQNAIGASTMADAATAAATNANQWYVSISRARKKVVVFTSDKAALRERIQHIGDRDLALELEPQNQKAAPGGYWTRRALEAAKHQRRHQVFTARTTPHPHAHRFSL